MQQYDIDTLYHLAYRDRVTNYYNWNWMDEKLNTSFLFIIFFFVGALAGGRNVYRLAQKISGGKDKMPSKLYGSNKRKE